MGNFSMGEQRMSTANILCIYAWSSELEKKLKSVLRWGRRVGLEDLMEALVRTHSENNQPSQEPRSQPTKLLENYGFRIRISKRLVLRDESLGSASMSRLSPPYKFYLHSLLLFSTVVYCTAAKFKLTAKLKNIFGADFNLAQFVKLSPDINKNTQCFPDLIII